VNDENLAALWLTLDPTGPQRRRIDRRVSAWLEARDTSLAAEWLTLFRGAPLPAFGLLSVGAAWVLAATPLVWVARALLRA
jgi:hypothetical protein